jgi:Cu+-exporting ATPase
MLTGEPVPAELGPGDAVTGGCLNVGGRLVVRATRVGADTQLAQIARLVREAQAAQCGIVIKGPEVLESTRAIDTIVLDKTGTVTTGRMSLAGVAAAPGVDISQLLRLAGAVEDASEHPVAAAIAVGVRDRLSGDLPAVESFASAKGLGVSGIVDGHAVAVGRAGWLELEWARQIPAELAARAAGGGRRGPDRRVAAWDGQVRGILIVADTGKPTSAEAVRRLRSMGLRPVLLTGDNGRAARFVADAVGIGEVIAGAVPAGKAAAVRQLQDAGRVVAMAGDGVNDAVALAQADLGLAMGAGTDAAIEASDLTLVRGDLLAVPDAILLARRTLATIKGNLFWAFGYNTAAIPLAALGFLNPLIAGAAMAFSSVFVVSNSLRLRRFQPGRRLRPPGRHPAKPGDNCGQREHAVAQAMSTAQRPAMSSSGARGRKRLQLGRAADRGRCL